MFEAESIFHSIHTVAGINMHKTGAFSKHKPLHLRNEKCSDDEEEAPIWRLNLEPASSFDVKQLQLLWQRRSCDC